MWRLLSLRAFCRVTQRLVKTDFRKGPYLGVGCKDIVCLLHFREKDKRQVFERDVIQFVEINEFRTEDTKPKKNVGSRTKERGCTQNQVKVRLDCAK